MNCTPPRLRSRVLPAGQPLLPPDDVVLGVPRLVSRPQDLVARRRRGWVERAAPAAGARRQARPPPRRGVAQVHGVAAAAEVVGAVEDEAVAVVLNGERPESPSPSCAPQLDC